MSEILAALVPPIGILVLFVIVIRALIGADRRERAARERIEAEVKAGREEREQEDG